MVICDCTLRDGGYYTNWDFNKKIVLKYLRTMENIEPIGIVELGYRSRPSQNYFGEYFYCPEYLLEEANKIAPSKKFAVMLNEKDCSIEELDVLLSPCKGYIHIVRLAVNPTNFERALKLVNPIKAMGFKVAFNIMYMSKWTKDEDFIKKLSSANGIIDYLYLVDSYGSMINEDIKDSFEKVKEHTCIPLGFHGHNNLEMALVNTNQAIKSGAKFVDSTITGMGRGAGNLKTELLLTYLNSKNYIDIEFTIISDLVSIFENMQSKYKWGTNLPYMISGAFSLPQAEVMDWMSKHRYSIHSIVMALQNKKENIIDNLKLKTFPAKIKYDRAIIIGGGSSAIKVKDAVEKYAKGKNLCIIMAGGRYYSEYISFQQDKYICLVGAEGLKFNETSPSNSTNETFIVPPSPRKMGTIIPKFANQVYELHSINFTKKSDSLLSVALQIAIVLEIKNVSLVGFDGYSNYNNPSIHEIEIENQEIIDNYLSEGYNLNSFTHTKYKNISQKSIYSFL